MSRLNQQSQVLPKALQKEVERVLDDWRSAHKVGRLWDRDPSLWTGGDEHNWLGWLRIVQEQLSAVQPLKDIAADVRAEGFAHAVLLGMGGSSLCPEVLAMTFGRQEGYPEFQVLDSTDPARVRAIESKLDLASTLFIVASKSGTTLEPAVFKLHFFRRVQEAVGKARTGSRFIAITDPGSALEDEAKADKFRATFLGLPEIGGRFSALSNFGMVPAAIMGIDTVKLLESASGMVEACSPASPPEENPGVLLGAILGAAALNGRNKLTLISSPAVWDLGAWIEQLMAESTGKKGKAIIPVDREPLSNPEVYGSDRLFAYIRLDSAPDPAQDAAVDALEEAGHPVVRICLADKYDLCQEFFRWEVATAVAGSVLGINPFNQPDVQFSKTETKKLTDAYEQTGEFPLETPVLETDGVRLFADSNNAGTLAALAGGARTLTGYLRAHLQRLTPGDYFALLAYIEMNQAHEDVLQEIRAAVRDNKRVATCLGFGPRFLHSTGQAHKAGPNIGVFLQITCDDAADIAVPGRKYSFGVVKAAQARGDFQVLSGRCRRAVRVHLGKDVAAGLKTLKAATWAALS